MKIAQKWKMVEIWMTSDGRFANKFTPLGTYTQATAYRKLNEIAKARGYKWKPVHTHGSGGYWVNADGDTIELLPSFD